MKRPDLKASLAPLKPFQRDTVEHAFHRMYTAPDSTGRFLVADEVGLGKTLVARGIVARTIEHLWEDVERIDIIYICSNASIGRANLPKLQVSGTDERALVPASRLTMLATYLAPRDGVPSPSESKLNFFSFTPGTSFNTGHSTGQRYEREVLFHVLEPLVGRRTALMNLMQGGVSNKDNWRKGLDGIWPIEDDVRARFETSFRDHSDLENRLHDVLDRDFSRYRQVLPQDVRARQNQMIGELRTLLAETCVSSLEPDLVILDEFQRFRSLIDTQTTDPGAKLAQRLFNEQAHDGQTVRTLLLSATPYKLYTTDEESIHENHYKDFLATTRFLLGDDESRVKNLETQLSSFGTALRQATASPQHGQPVGANVKQAKRAVEASLRDVMARTERVAADEERDAMLEERRQEVPVTAADVRQYLASDALFRAVGDHDPMPLWKSAPYLPHFMREYRFNRLLNKLKEPGQIPHVLREHDAAFLKQADLENWRELEPAHPKLRALVAQTLDAGLWRLLWMPPTVSYWPLEGPFTGMEDATKRLLFSAWNVVPDAVTGVLSYEAERRMSGGRDRQPLLRWDSDGNRTRHRLFLPLAPCKPLADVAHPLAAPPNTDRRAWVRAKVEELLQSSGLPDPQEGPVDDRWEWAAPLLLDSGLKSFLAAWRDGQLELAESLPSVPMPYLGDLLAVDPGSLGRRPEGLVDLLTDVALGSPAILALRTLHNGADVSDTTRRGLAMQVADALWRLFNRPAVIEMLQPGTQAARRNEGPYWRTVLQYCQQGNLQAVLDEQWHLLREQESWATDASDDDIAGRCVKTLVDVIRPKPARVHARFLKADDASLAQETMRIRSVFALRFGHLESDEVPGGADGVKIAPDVVRSAFNSPFRPFVLASTSIGQEGLDFHPWCSQLVHWNLPGNPVDMEQREGRVHRYKCHAVRRNVAAAHADEALAGWRLGDDLWASIFELANGVARAEGASDLIPNWIAPGGHRVQRYVPLLSHSDEVAAFRRLKRQLAAYRVVFGQPRQEEMLALLDHADIDTKQLQDWAIDLKPPKRSTPD